MVLTLDLTNIYLEKYFHKGLCVMAQSTKHASIFNIRNIRYGHVVIVGVKKICD